MARLDQELVRRALARSRTHAAALIAAGQVSSGGTVLVKAARQIDPDRELAVAGSGGPDYVSRAGHKLAGALDAFPDIVVAGKRCLDAGASTGGFTDVLLRRAASRVVAVDVGHGQLAPALRADRRVEVHEGLNIRYLQESDIGGAVELTVCDLSFISLTLVMVPLALATQPGADLLLMVKPQFEVGRQRLSRTGVVGSEHERCRAVSQVAAAAVAAGLELRGLAVSPLPGQDGNVEYFLWVVRTQACAMPKIEEQQASVQRLLAEIWAPTTNS
ncbi:TlyA family RNA methyltransferase [Paenarthrobacter sp. PH39-S1]|uniref:TlyA family RNA methyltransferase n=1 Tax=Paenarthrobacter sp. PH39-S1 TaxID=3046204 RepID=UPI0024BAE525|nr:TlyA family RNA methyltransferase [Paenarthrobacter sp. PH39-S1]MDJ0357731.1 TlyA family RNA methyltransferase [Paenarthrobacter sp. PH39-S1]